MQPRPKPSAPTLVSLSLTAIVLTAPAVAQSIDTDAFSDLPPPAQRAAPEPAPDMRFRLESEIPLPGPLPGRSPRWVDGRVEIPVRGGLARAAPVAGGPVEVVPAPATDEASEASVGADAGWVVDASEKRRYRALPEGRILAERRCRRCDDGWKKSWKLRVAGTTPAPPLVGPKRVYFGAMDNRIYCVRSRNGHRVWVRDMGSRVSNALALWEAEPEKTDAAEEERPGFVLVVPDDGSKLLALVGRSGVEAASVRLASSEGKIVGAPLITPDARVVVARQKYAESDASLMIYALEPTPGEDASAVGTAVTALSER